MWPRQRKGLLGTAPPGLARGGGCEPRDSKEGRSGGSIGCGRGPACVGYSGGTRNARNTKTAVLHATVSISGGVSFSGSYDARLTVQTCAGVAKGGTGQHDGTGKAMFYVPIPMDTTGGNGGPVGGGHTFGTDTAAAPYHGPGTYTGSGLVATQMDADTPPGSQDTHIFAFPTNIGTMVINPDASGSFTFGPLQDPGSVLISGEVTWTCSEVRVGTN